MLDAHLQRLCEALARDSVGPADDLFDLARAHRVDALLAQRVRATDRLRASAALDLPAERDLIEICDAAHEHGIEMLLLKGSALAYTHYPAPHLRPRGDIDMLIRRRDLDRAAHVLTRMGYERSLETDAEIWTGQRHYARTSAAGPVLVDLHWRAANPRLCAGALAFDEVWPRSVAVPALGAHARTLSPADSLVLACLHRVAHHQDRIQLLWLWDIHLLASRMSAAEFASFASGAAGAKLGVVCARGLALARECFGTAVPDELLAELAAAKGEPAAAFVGAAFSPFDVAFTDLAALSGWRARVSLVREHLFPSAAYMRRRYPRWPAVLLPIAYVHRIVAGAPRWLRR